MQTMVPGKWLIPKVYRELKLAKNPQITQLEMNRGLTHILLQKYIKMANRYMKRC